MLEGQGQGSEPNPPALLPYFLHDQYKCRITAFFFFFFLAFPLSFLENKNEKQNQTGHSVLCEYAP